MESEHEILTKKKLELEIEDLQKAWYKKPKYIAAWSPIIIALLSFIAIWLSGYFDTQKEKLNKEISELEETRNKLISETSALKDSLKYEKILRYEAVLSITDKFIRNYPEIHVLNKYLCSNFDDNIKFYNAIKKCNDFESFLKEFKLVLIISNRNTIKIIEYDTTDHIIINIKDKYDSYYIDEYKDCIYLYNKSSFTTNEKGLLMIKKNFSNLQNLLNKNFVNILDSLDYYNIYIY